MKTNIRVLASRFEQTREKLKPLLGTDSTITAGNALRFLNDGACAPAAGVGDQHWEQTWFCSPWPASSVIGRGRGSSADHGHWTGASDPQIVSQDRPCVLTTSTTSNQ